VEVKHGGKKKNLGEGRKGTRQKEWGRVNISVAKNALKKEKGKKKEVGKLKRLYQGGKKKIHGVD